MHGGPLARWAGLEAVRGEHSFPVAPTQEQEAEERPAPSHNPPVPATHGSLSAAADATSSWCSAQGDGERVALHPTGDRAPQLRDGTRANGTMSMWTSPLKGQDARLLPALAAPPGVVFPNAAHA